MREEIKSLIRNNLLQEFLAQKPLYYDEIDYTRMPRVYETIKDSFSYPKVIHIIGTNGKGTTGRFLATALLRAGYSVGHYSSPHILEFNERIWLNGANVSSKLLETTHQKLLQILTQEQADSLSYFEYTTLLAMYLYQESAYVVLEAGLGGEHDATAVFDNILTLITPIAKDHEAFLGNTIEEIVRTKVNAVQKTAILATQINSEVERLSKSIIEQKGSSFFHAEALLLQEDRLQIKEIQSLLSLEDYLLTNLTLAIAALKYLQVPYTPKSFENARLFGRLTPMNENIIVDVGHNVLAALAIEKALHGRKFTLVYNSYKDKNYKEILAILKPIIYAVEIINVEDVRIEKVSLLEETLSQLAVKYGKFKGIDKDTKYLVFGSFSVVEAFLKVYNE